MLTSWLTFRTHSSMCCAISSCVRWRRPWQTGHDWHVMFAYASSSNFRLRSLPRNRPCRFTRIRWNVCCSDDCCELIANQLKHQASVVLTSHRLLRLCKLLCTACSSMLSVRRISWRSLYMFGFANRPNSAEKCDSSSSGDNWMPQIGHELWPVADVAPMCIGFFGPIPGIGWERDKNLFYTSIKFSASVFCFICDIIIFSSILRPLNMGTFDKRANKAANEKTLSEPINAFLTETLCNWCGCVAKYLKKCLGAKNQLKNGLKLKHIELCK